MMLSLKAHILYYMIVNGMPANCAAAPSEKRLYMTWTLAYINSTVSTLCHTGGSTMATAADMITADAMDTFWDHIATTKLVLTVHDLPTGQEAAAEAGLADPMAAAAAAEAQQMIPIGWKEAVTTAEPRMSPIGQAEAEVAADQVLRQP
jgi:hypothetical protein